MIIIIHDMKTSVKKQITHIEVKGSEKKNTSINIENRIYLG